ncbi:MAG: GntR family transcriptional regulator [Ruminococcaceae bacterium]|nr:GntR family transcriptional regulator [Oscillospiraceae bacterium]
MFQPDGASTLEEKVYNILEDQILSQKLRAGDSVTEMKLSKELGVSRTPVREALQRLDREGLIKLRPNKGAVVVGISERDLIDIYKIRTRLEGLAARIAAENADETLIRQLSDNIELTEFYMSKGNIEKLKDLDSDFHDIIYGYCQSRILGKTLSELHRYIVCYRKLSLSVKGRLERSLAEHREIVEAIKKGDADGADSLMSAHVELALSNLLTIIQNKD